MKKFKFGFTVVEMITAMAIVGITAAFVIPMSVKAFNKHQAGIVLGKVYSQILQGNQNIIQLTNMNDETGNFVNSLSTIVRKDLFPNTQINPNDFIINNLTEVICPFWGLNNTQIDKEDVLPIKKFNGDGDVDNNNSNVSNILNNACTRFNLSNSSASVAIFDTNAQSPDAPSDDTQYVIYVDTTGLKNPPNTYGKDIFAFILINNGTLRPFGAGEDPGNNGLGFTERVVREGFRVTYY